MVPQNFQYGRARAGDFARLAPQPAGKRGHFLPVVRMRVRSCFHGALKVAPAIFEIKGIANRLQIFSIPQNILAAGCKVCERLPEVKIINGGQ